MAIKNRWPSSVTGFESLITPLSALFPNARAKRVPFCIIALNKPWDQRHRRPSVHGISYLEASHIPEKAQRLGALSSGADAAAPLNPGRDSLTHETFIPSRIPLPLLVKCMRYSQRADLGVVLRFHSTARLSRLPHQKNK